MASLDDLLRTVQKDKKLLSKEEEIKLGEIIQSPTSSEISKQTAIKTLVLKNIYLVVKICHKYKRKEFEFEDLVSYGILGLYKAAYKFDPTRKNRFASYARHWIKDGIMKAIREYSGLPKIPVYLVKNLWHTARILVNEEKISDEELGNMVGISEKNAAYLRTLMFKAVKFDESYVTNFPKTPEEDFAEKEKNQLIYKTLHEVLTEDEFIVLAHIHELCGFKKMTFARIENELNIKNPRKLKAAAMKKLKKNEILQVVFKEGF